MSFYVIYVTLTPGYGRQTRGILLESDWLKSAATAPVAAQIESSSIMSCTLLAAKLLPLIGSHNLLLTPAPKRSLPFTRERQVCEPTFTQKQFPLSAHYHHDC
jgi:hypothetical protein